MGIGEPTVKKHVRHILEKLGLLDRLQAGLFLARNPLLLETQFLNKVQKPKKSADTFRWTGHGRTDGRMRRSPIGIELRLPPLSGLAAVVSGGLALLGWQTGVHFLRSVAPGFVAMNPMTAICFMLAGLALWILTRDSPRPRDRNVAAGLALLVSLIGAVKLWGMLSGHDLALDQLLFRDQLETVQPPNRMAPNTAWNFVLVGLSLLVLSLEQRGTRSWSQILGLAPLLLSFPAILGYAYEVGAFYRVAVFIPMALNTALTFLALSLGIIFALPDRGLAKVVLSQDPGGTLLRRYLPLSILSIGFIGWITLRGARAGLYDMGFAACLADTLAIVVIAVIALLSSAALGRVERARHATAEALRKAHDELEMRVVSRTAELEDANRERSQLEKQFLQAQKMEAVGRLAGGVAHDFNNLLTAIMGYGQMMKLKLGPDDPARNDAEEILKAAARGASLTRQLLIFSRQQVVEFHVLDLNLTIAGMDKMLRRLVGEDIDMVTVPAANLGRVRADSGQLEQVLMNLAINARDAMPQGGKLTIETSNVELNATYAKTHLGVKPGHYAMLAVSDTGTGMTPEVVAHLFEPFFTTKEAGKGTGLGLSTVHGIVSKSGGQIDVYTQTGHGTTFKVYLPIAEQDSDEVKAQPVEPGACEGNETVLIVEDEEAIRRLMHDSLALYGYTVLEAVDGSEAIGICERRDQRIDLLITDVIMPLMNGPDLAKRIALIRPELRMLFVSGYTDRAVVHQGLVGRTTAFLQKPFMPEALARKVRDVLDQPLRSAA